MDLRQKLKDQGWYITDEGLSKLPEGLDKTDTRKVVQSLLDIDLRDVAGGALPTEVSKKDDTIAGKVVLQVAKIRNISAPKANEESKTAPRLLHLELTDGVTQAFALEFEHISSISLNTPPGAKIFLRSERVPLMQGILVLRPNDVQVLGGKVPALVDKWEMSRTLLKYARGGRIMTGSAGPPPWIPFGQKIQAIESDKNFKSLGGSGADKETKENNEFDAMRNEAIAEAAKVGAKKIFGGGNQQILDHNVKKIIEKGYTEDEAKNALKATRNNLERALFNLKRREEYRERSDFKESGGRGAMGGKRGAFKDGKKGGKDEAGSDKPAGNVSLFDFLTDKLPANAEPTERPATTTNSTSSSRPERSAGKYESSKPYGSYQSQGSNSISQGSSSTAGATALQQQSQSATNRPKFENNISSSFANRGGSANPSDNESNYRNRNKNTRGGGHSGGSGSYAGRHSESGRGGGIAGASSGFTRNQNRASNERERNANYQTASSNNESRNQRNDHQRNGCDNKQYNKAPPSSRYPTKDNHSTSGYNNNPSSNRSYLDSRDNRHQTHTETEKVNKLVEDTAKLKIDQTKPISSGRGGGHHNTPRNHSNLSQNNHQQTQSVSTQAQQHATVYTQLPNGFAYDPNKIMGFQNKETNEFAMTMLKSQTIPQTITPQNTHSQFSQPPPPLQQGAYPGPQFLMQTQHVPAFGMNPIPTSLECGWNWKIGDRCMAKYWDDGRYYDAEITGLSDKTCVVWFLGYGNYEEVLKTDCVPYTDAQNRPINNSHPIAHQQLAQQQQSQMNIRGGAGGAGSNVTNTARYRGERQMYVPPPKREI